MNDLGLTPKELHVVYAVMVYDALMTENFHRYGRLSGSVRKQQDGICPCSCGKLFRVPSVCRDGDRGIMVPFTKLNISDLENKPDLLQHLVGLSEDDVQRHLVDVHVAGMERLPMSVFSEHGRADRGRDGPAFSYVEVYGMFHRETLPCDPSCR